MAFSSSKPEFTRRGILYDQKRFNIPQNIVDLMITNDGLKLGKKDFIFYYLLEITHVANPGAYTDWDFKVNKCDITKSREDHMTGFQRKGYKWYSKDTDGDVSLLKGDENICPADVDISGWFISQLERTIPKYTEIKAKHPKDEIMFHIFKMYHPMHTILLLAQNACKEHYLTGLAPEKGYLKCKELVTSYIKNVIQPESFVEKISTPQKNNTRHTQKKKQSYRTEGHNGRTKLPSQLQARQRNVIHGNIRAYVDTKTGICGPVGHSVSLAKTADVHEVDPRKGEKNTTPKERMCYDLRNRHEKAHLWPSIYKDFKLRKHKKRAKDAECKSEELPPKKHTPLYSGAGYGVDVTAVNLRRKIKGEMTMPENKVKDFNKLTRREFDVPISQLTRWEMDSTVFESKLGDWVDLYEDSRQTLGTTCINGALNDVQIEQLKNPGIVRRVGGLPKTDKAFYNEKKDEFSKIMRDNKGRTERTRLRDAEPYKWTAVGGIAERLAEAKKRRSALVRQTAENGMGLSDLIGYLWVADAYDTAMEKVQPLGKGVKPGFGAKAITTKIDYRRSVDAAVIAEYYLENAFASIDWSGMNKTQRRWLEKNRHTKGHTLHKYSESSCTATDGFKMRIMGLLNEICPSDLQLQQRNNLVRIRHRSPQVVEW